jgi:hypothetical protein
MTSANAHIRYSRPTRRGRPRAAFRDGAHHWSAERARLGWTLGPVRHEAARRTPYLVLYADQPETIKEYDRAPVREILDLLATIGYRVVRR